jgi:hypothetical protein
VRELVLVPDAAILQARLGLEHGEFLFERADPSDQLGGEIRQGLV